MFKGFIQKYLPRLYNNLDSVFTGISELDYVTLDDYKKDLGNVKDELEEVESTINYYVSRKRSLESWKHELEVRIATFGERDVCCNCRHYSKLYCNLYSFSVNKDATCHSFEWNDKDIILDKKKGVNK